MSTNEITIDTNKDRLDMDVIHGFLSTAYWSAGRTKSEIQTSIDNSVNFGVYKKGMQIGFARVLTDYIVFGYLMDVFIVESERGKGYSKQLLQYIFTYSDLEPVKHWALATSDAHGLYEQFGFEVLEFREKMMVRK